MRETITVAEAAEFLGLSVWTIYDLARRHEIPHVRIGSRVQFRRNSLCSWLEQKEASSLIVSREPRIAKITQVKVTQYHEHK